MERKLKIFRFFLAVFFLVLWGRLFELQILQGTKNRLLADTNRIQKRIIVAPRGLLLDRHGEILAESEPEYSLAGKKINRDEALQLQVEKKDSNLTINFKRKYNSGQDFAHVVGFLGEVTDWELKDQKLSLRGYSAGDLLGRSGVEEEYEDLLRGQKGSQSIEVDTLGRVVRQLAQSPPVPGKSLTLSIDKNLQETAARAMGERKGAIVATNPQNGEVLVFYSSPSFDPNIFLDEKRQGEVVKLIKDEETQPLLNRVISGLYPPGSTFKIVTSIAGLEEGKITPGTLINDPGVIEVNNFKFANWYFTQYGRTEGEINLVRALARSTDTFFYKVGEILGVDSLIKWAKRFGLDQSFGIDLPAEIKGFVGSPEWKEKTFGEKWFLGNTYHLAIGQGDIALTPLGVNLMTGVVANGGKLCKPRILRIGAENTPYQAECQDLGIRKEFLEVVKEGMIGACSRGGTGWPFFDFKPRGLPADWRVACKTGTAETGDGKTSHAWFTVFAPADNPEIVLTVLVEKGGEGSSVAGPIAKEILKEYFKIH
ncbi:MAG: penicillin-binding protein 2 [Microgenomates group bacterium]